MTFGTTQTLLTLGCQDYDSKNLGLGWFQTPTKINRPENKGAGKWVVTNKTGVNPVNDLFVDTKTKTYHTITFNGNYNRLNVDTAKHPDGCIDSADTLFFNGTISRSTIVTGNSKSLAGDNITFKGAVTNTTITTSAKNDLIVFSNTSPSPSGTTVNVGSGVDSIKFESPTQVGPGTTINLGGALPSTGDGAVDIIFAASKSTFENSGITINNFVDNQDQIRLGTTIITKKADALTEFGAGSITFG